MPTVEAILQRKGRHVHSVPHDATVLEAARRMNEHRIGALVVVREDRVVGIFTERDVLNRVVAAQRDPATTRVQEVMSSPVACCSPQTTRNECRHVMRQRRIRHLPVVDGEKLVGIISIGDINTDEGEEQQQTIRYLYEYMYVDWT